MIPAAEKTDDIIIFGEGNPRIDGSLSVTVHSGVGVLQDTPAEAS